MAECTGNEQGPADQALREAFSGIAQPSLSLSFDKELRAKLAVERRRQRAARLWTRLQRIYWLFAGLSTAVILSHLHRPELPHSEPWLPVLALIITVALPVLLVMIAGRTDPIDLFLTTFEEAETPPTA